jgi:SAM-dependent methyltransferase
MTSETGPDLGAVASLYEESLEKYGMTAPAVGWRDERDHELRFRKLVTLIDEDGEWLIADLGCGYGAFYGYLQRAKVKVKKFVGYDVSEKMLVEARRRVPEGEFICGNSIDREVDFSFACGIFNVRLAAQEATWHDHIVRTLDNLHERSTRGFAFNLLSTYVDYCEPHLYYADPGAFFSLCKQRYASKVALLHDYPLYEWTILVRK